VGLVGCSGLLRRQVVLPALDPLAPASAASCYGRAVRVLRPGILLPAILLGVASILAAKARHSAAVRRQYPAIWFADRKLASIHLQMIRGSAARPPAMK